MGFTMPLDQQKNHLDRWLEAMCDKPSGWWSRATPLKNMTSSIGMMRATQYSWENKIDGNQTTNQLHCGSEAQKM